MRELATCEMSRMYVVSASKVGVVDVSVVFHLSTESQFVIHVEEARHVFMENIM